MTRSLLTIATQLSTLPLPVAAVPWFFTEFMPEQLLEFGTKASAWTGAYGIERFGPPLINATLSKLPENVRSVLLKDIFAGEKVLTQDLQTQSATLQAYQPTRSSHPVGATSAAPT